MWHPETIEKLFQVNFDMESAKKSAIEQNIEEEFQDGKNKKGKGKAVI